MYVVDFLRREHCVASLRGQGKEDVLRELVETLTRSGAVKDGPRTLKALMDRESLGSTGIGDGVAIPHAKLAGAETLTAAFGRSVAGVDYHAVDDKPVTWVFLLIAPEGATGQHLKALARISRMFKSEEFRRTLEEASNAEELYAMLQKEDAALP